MSVDLANGAKPLQAAEVSTVSAGVKQNAIPAITSGDYVVEGERRYNGWFLSAERIVFKPGSKLIFSKTAVAARTNLFVLAKEITSESAESPGEIVWEQAPLSLPPDSGTAQAGIDNGAQLKVAGGPGDTGKLGLPGQSGADAPSITLVALWVKAPLLVTLAGQQGGQGGKGQNGGRGGGGGRGGAFTLITANDNMAAASRFAEGGCFRRSAGSPRWLRRRSGCAGHGRSRRR